MPSAPIACGHAKSHLEGPPVYNLVFPISTPDLCDMLCQLWVAKGVCISQVSLKMAKYDMLLYTVQKWQSWNED